MQVLIPFVDFYRFLNHRFFLQGLGRFFFSHGWLCLWRFLRFLFPWTAMLAVLESMEGYLAATVVALYSLLQIFFWGFWLFWRGLLFRASPLQGRRSRDFNLLFHRLLRFGFFERALPIAPHHLAQPLQDQFLLSAPSSPAGCPFRRWCPGEKPVVEEKQLPSALGFRGVGPHRNRGGAAGAGEVGERELRCSGNVPQGEQVTR